MIRTFKQVAKYVYETLGPGHEEAIYRDAMSVELQDRGYTVKMEAPISIRYKLHGMMGRFLKGYQYDCLFIRTN